MNFFTLVIHGDDRGRLAASFGEDDHSHHAEIARLLAHAGQQLKSGSATQGDLIDGNGVNVGEWYFNKTRAKREG